MDSSPHLLLVDSGAWYYGSDINYYETALDDLGYRYHQKRIRYLPQDTPTITNLLPFDTVIWSSPADSPGYLGVGEVISDYLATGGNRSEILGRALDWFSTPRPTVGVTLLPAESRWIYPAGTSITHTLQLRNTGERGAGDSISLSVTGASCPTTAITPTRFLSA